MLLKQLTQLSGIAGNEKEVRKFIIDEIRPYVDEIKTDYIGNIIATKKGNPGFAKVMVAAHMDEVGLIVKSIDEAGFIKFVEVGGVDARILVSKPVCIGDKKVPGVIGAKAIHLQTKDESNSPLTIKQLYIDIGAKNKADAEKLIKKGDYIAFDSDYIEFGSDLVKAKALDDRCGCANIIELLKETYDVTIVAAFTVQEELGLRGATIAAYHIAPDFALVLEGTICSDITKVPDEATITKLGHGPAISMLDSHTLFDKTLTKRLYSLGEESQIKMQYRRPSAGGNDAGAIHLSREGIPCLALSVPCRYIHSPSSVMNKNDYEGYKAITKLFLKSIKEGEFIRE